MQSRVLTLGKQGFIYKNDNGAGVGWSRVREKLRGMRTAAVGQTRVSRQAGRQSGRQAGRWRGEMMAEWWIDPGTEEDQVSTRNSQDRRFRINNSNCQI